MAVVLLDSIINETIQNFRGHELLEQSLGGGGPSNQDSSLASGLQSDQIDSLTSLMQDVEMSQNERIFWILLFSLMVLVAAGGNIIVIYIVSTNKEMKSVTNYFLVNLSLADTMVSTLNVIFNFISMLNSHWPFGKIYCKISNFIAILSISASVFTLTAISCDRYNAIIYPLRPRMSRKHAIAWILLIWTLSSALAMPNAIFSVVVEDRLVNENLALTCTMIWPDGRYPLSSYDHIYNIIILVVTYLVPIITMAILYYQVGKELWGYEAIGENVEKQRRAIVAKKKIVKMMIVVVIIFALCWLPYHGFFIVNFYLPTIFQDGPLLYQRCYLIIYWLAMSNSMYNPVIIYFMNSKFRHEFRRVLWMICCCRQYVAPLKNENSNHQQHHHHHHQTAAATTTTTTTANTVAQVSADNQIRASHSSGGGTAATRRPANQSNHHQARSSNTRANSNLLPAHDSINSRTNCSAPSAITQAIAIPIEVIITQTNGQETAMINEGQSSKNNNGLAHEREPFLNDDDDAPSKTSPLTAIGETTTGRTQIDLSRFQNKFHIQPKHVENRTKKTDSSANMRNGMRFDYNELSRGGGNDSSIAQSNDELGGKVWI